MEPRKKYMTIQNAYDLIMKLTPIALNEKQAYYCYAMCKMTVVDEAEEATLRYKRL